MEDNGFPCEIVPVCFHLHTAFVNLGKRRRNGEGKRAERMEHIDVLECKTTLKSSHETWAFFVLETYKLTSIHFPFL